MKRAAGLLAVAAAAAIAAVVIAGPDAFGRGALALGLPSVAAALIEDPIRRGGALHQAGRHDQAAAVFAAAGARYNEGVAAAHAGDYAAALAAFDAALTSDPTNAAARANYDIVAALFAGTELDGGVIPTAPPRDGPTLAAETGRGGARANASGDEANNKSTALLAPELKVEGLRRVEKIFDGHRLRASERWLETLQDEPGLYLKARLAARQAARVAAGAALPPAEDPR